jgi:hypothetical protein
MMELWNGGTVYRQILINVKLQIGKRSKKTELIGRSTLRRRRYVLDCSAVEGEGEKGETEGGGGRGE